MNPKRFPVWVLVLVVLLSMATTALQAQQSQGDHPDFTAGLQAYFQGNYSNALNGFKKAVDARPDNARYHFFLGNTYKRLNRDTMAIRTYESVLEKDTSHRTARRRLADLYYNRGTWSKSARHYRSLMGDTDVSEDVVFRLARSLFEQDEFDRAKSHFLRVRDRSPRRADVYYNLGRILLEEGEFYNAISRLNRAVELNDSRGEYYFYRGLAYFRQEDYLSESTSDWKSASDFQRAIDLGHRDPRTNFMLGNSLLNRGLYLMREDRDEKGINLLKKSIRQYRQVLAGEFNASNAYHNMGVAYLGIGKLEMARKSIEQAILIEPTIPFFHDSLGDVYFEQGEFQEAIESWQLVQELDPDYDGSPFRKLLQSGTISEKINRAKIRR
jgi:tetratricopeptide (TPR) repeat protein